MALKLAEIEDALMPEMPRKPRQSDQKAYKKWQAKAEDGYKNLSEVGVKIVKEYFESNAIGVCGAAPWGKLPADKNLFRNQWESFVKRLLTTETLKDKDSSKQIKAAIYMGSQEVWLEEECQKDKEFKIAASELSYEMRYRLILLKNGDQKKDFVVGFTGDKGHKKTLPAFIQALNLNYWSHKKCKALLRKITSLETQIEQLKEQQPYLGEKKEISIPEKPSLTGAINLIKYGHLKEWVENKAYVKYMSNSQHFKKLSPEERDELIAEIYKWKTLAEYSPEALPLLDMVYYVLKASANL